MAFSIGLGCLPIIWSISLSSGPITGYVLAVYNGHVYPFIPAISDTGSKSPEASIFSMLMNVSISICVINLYVRYHQCDLQVKQCGGDIKDTLIRLNSTAVSFAAVSIVGAVIVANFQSSQVNISPSENVISHQLLQHQNDFCSKSSRYISIHTSRYIHI